MYKIGERVQAVCELGRWSAAKVLDLENEGAKVGFIGWGAECDRVVGPREIRKTVDPFQECIRKYWRTFIIIMDCIRTAPPTRSFSATYKIRFVWYSMIPRPKEERATPPRGM